MSQSEENGEDRLGMTPDEWATFTAWTHGFPNHDENGVDLSLLRANLKLTPEERVRKLERAAAALLELSRARRTTVHQDR